jgi:hypothetical protein
MRGRIIEIAQKLHGFKGRRYGLEVDSDAAVDFMSDIATRSHDDIVNDCNKLAIRLARSEEYDVRDDAEMWTFCTGHMSRFWMDAMIACEELRGDDVENALSEVLECHTG